MLDSVSTKLPAVMEAYQMTTKVSRVDFDWPDVASVIEKLDARSRLEAVARASSSDGGGIMGTVALGIGHQDVAMPAHIGLFYDAEPDLRLRQLEFLRPAIERLSRAEADQ